MKNSGRILVMLSFVLPFACTNKTNDTISEFEKTQHQVEVKKVIALSEFNPFYGKDSVTILQTLYDTTLNIKLRQLDEYSKNRSRTRNDILKEIPQMDNPKMIKIFEQKAKIIGEELEQTERIKNVYINTPEHTQLNEIIRLMDFYQSINDSLLGYTIKVNFIGKEGLLPKKEFQRNYFFNTKKTKIISSLK